MKVTLRLPDRPAQAKSQPASYTIRTSSTSHSPQPQPQPHHLPPSLMQVETCVLVTWCGSGDPASYHHGHHHNYHHHHHHHRHHNHNSSNQQEPRPQQQLPRRWLQRHQRAMARIGAIQRCVQREFSAGEEAKWTIRNREHGGESG